jgi:hypothetical protein
VARHVCRFEQALHGASRAGAIHKSLHKVTGFEVPVVVLRSCNMTVQVPSMSAVPASASEFPALLLASSQRSEPSRPSQGTEPIHPPEPYVTLSTEAAAAPLQGAREPFEPSQTFHPVEHNELPEPLQAQACQVGSITTFCRVFSRAFEITL